RLAQERQVAMARELALREVNERLDTFAVMAAHDLRQPVSVCRLSVEVAQRMARNTATRVDSPGTKQLVLRTEEALATADRRLDSLWRLMQQLLDVTRVRSGTLVLERRLCSLDELIRATVEEQRLLTPARTITLDLPEPEEARGQSVLVHADASRLGQVL